MSSQIIPLKARADSQDRAELRPWRPLAFELQRRDTQLGAGFCRDLQQAFCTDVGHHSASPRRHALLALEGRRAEPPENPMSADRVRWEHIQRIYELCGRNVSQTARRLNMHRRTLQRILAKRAPK
jgi:DNA-binding NtrC family response regulator